eukprot:scaffold262074_cov23-Tisochrysis_lutea.AAC.3
MQRMDQEREGSRALREHQAHLEDQIKDALLRNQQYEGGIYAGACTAYLMCAQCACASICACIHRKRRTQLAPSLQKVLQHSSVLHHVKMEACAACPRYLCCYLASALCDNKGMYSLSQHMQKNPACVLGALILYHLPSLASMHNKADAGAQILCDTLINSGSTAVEEIHALKEAVYKEQGRVREMVQQLSKVAGKVRMEQCFIGTAGPFQMNP